tara:strand:+ start:761 stop:976 length:216 start_codon:yes stop_codon:yes gene_type:complete
VSKFILLSIILTTTAFSTAKTMASDPSAISFNICQSGEDFWTYGAGYLEDNKVVYNPHIPEILPGSLHPKR